MDLVLVLSLVETAVCVSKKLGPDMNGSSSVSSTSFADKRGWSWRGWGWRYCPLSYEYDPPATNFVLYTLAYCLKKGDNLGHGSWSFIVFLIILVVFIRVTPIEIFPLTSSTPHCRPRPS